MKKPKFRVGQVVTLYDGSHHSINMVSVPMLTYQVGRMATWFGEHELCPLTAREVGPGWKRVKGGG